MKSHLLNLKLIPFLIIIIITAGGCTNTNKYTEEGWTIQVNSEDETFKVSHSDLGVIIRDARLNIKHEGKLSSLTGWNVQEATPKQTDLSFTETSGNILLLTTNEPDTTHWGFQVTDEGLEVKTSAKNGFITGTAPASGERIPARVESQDNGIMYTSLGYVSARNIYSLFDRMSNTLIQFPENSRLVRNAEDEKLMNTSFHPAAGVEIALIPEYYTRELGLDHYEPYYPQYKDKHPFKKAPTGWLSWYAYYMSCNQKDMVRETNALADILKPYGVEYVQLDATFTEGADANWVKWNKEKFPKGGKWLMQYISDKGLKPGLWVNVYGDNYANPCFRDQYPEDWFLHDPQGNLISACCVADSTVVKLDFSKPGVIEEYLRPLFHTLVDEWGVRYLKDAGHGEWMFTYEEFKDVKIDEPIGKRRVSDGVWRYNKPSADTRELYWNVQDIIRNIMGPRGWIMGCDAEGGSNKYSLGFGTFDSAFNILQDVYAVWEEYVWAEAMGTKMHLATIFSTNYLNDIVIYNDPDATMVRPPLTMSEAVNNVSTVALSGQSYMISDFLSELSKEQVNRVSKETRWGKEFPHLVKKLPEERIDLYKKTMPATNITPIDLFPYRSEVKYGPLPKGYPSEENFPRAMDLKVNAASGVYDVVSVYNWMDKEDEKSITFGKDLGLDPEEKYLVFDFWNEQLVGTFKNSVSTVVPPHGANVLVIKEQSSNPQLLATSRHITCAHSINSLTWDEKSSTMEGGSTTVIGDPYSLFVYVPDGMSVSNVEASHAEDISYSMQSDHLLEITFESTQEMVDWSIELEK